MATLLKRRAFLALLLLAWLPFFRWVLQIYASTTMPQMAMLTMTPASFHDFFETQTVFVFFMTVYAGAGLIANDRRVHALQLYLSRPLGRWEYIMGKLAIVASFLVMVTWVPAMLLLVIQALLTGSVMFVREQPWIVPAITVVSVTVVTVASCSMLALSSLSTSSRFVGMLYAGLVLFTRALFEVTRGITGSTSTSWLSVTASLEHLGDLAFQQPTRHSTPLVVSVLVLATLVAVSAAVLDRRVRGVEVVT